MCRWDTSLLFEKGEGRLVIKTYRSLISTVCLGASLTKDGCNKIQHAQRIAWL